MAVVLDALAPLVKKMITDMLKEEMSMLRGVSGEISKLEGNLGHLQNFLTDAERRRITDVGVQAWVGKLKRAMYEAADIVDLCQLEAMEHQEDEHSSGLCSLEGLLILGPFVACLGGVLQPFLFCMQNPGFAHEVASRIKKLNNELDTIRKGAVDFNFNINLNSYATTRPTSSAYVPKREVAQYVESDVVGEQIEKNTAFLLQRLLADHDSAAVKVVAIVGLGGIGKSTLAKKILASEAIKEEFKTIWLSISHRFSRVDLLRTAITCAGGKHGGEKDETLLVGALTDALSKKKFLLVLDDVWDAKQAWQDLLRVPVVNAGLKQPGSRVLVTTRKEDVVQRMEVSNRDQLHVAKLDGEDAWCLLKKQLPQPLVGVESDFVELKEIGMKIVKICDGLPIAIKVMGGVLSTRRPNEDDWGFVLQKNLEWQKEGPQEELNYSVSLSYDDLSPELKQCFLYYSLFPKGSGFIEDRVISMWISEGLIQNDRRLESGQLDLEKIGAEYHRQLVAKNLLEPDDSSENIWDYTLHDVIRSFAQFMAREEAFVVHKDQAGIRNLLPENQKFRRLSIELIDSELEWTILENQETLRTLLIDCDIKPGGSLANFASLRVLDIKSEESDWLVDSLCKLRHLRYLSFSNTNISRLPADIHKMRFLLHIQLDHCTKLDKLPDSITKLAHLRYLSIEGSNIDVVPRGFGSLTDLRSLFGFPVKMDGDWCTLEELGALSHLINLKVQSLENVPDGSIAKRAKIRSKEHLEYLELSCYKDEKEVEEDDDDEEEEGEDEGGHGKMEDEKIEDEEDEDEEEDGQTEYEKIEDGEDEDEEKDVQTEYEKIEHEEYEDDEEDGRMEDEKIGHEEYEDEEEDGRMEDEKIGHEEYEDDEEDGRMEDEKIEDEEDEDEEEDGRMEDEKIEDEDEEDEDEDEEDGQMVDEKIADEEDEEEDVQTEDEKIEDEETEEGKQIEEEAGKEVQQIGVEQQQRMEVVFDELCPPPTLHTLIISRYYGRRMPNWMQSPAEITFKRLKSIDLLHITYCTRLPDGLCRILSLEKLLIDDAPAIEHVGPEFQTTHARGGGRMTVAAAFPQLRRLLLHGLTGWKEWDWKEEQSKVIAIPALEHLTLTDCKLTHLPPGLASDRRHNLRTIFLVTLTLLEYVESFPSVVELHVVNCPKLKRISALSMLQTVYIDSCPELKLLEGVPALDSLTLDDEPWKVTGTDATCTPKRYQDGLPPQLPQDLIITR